MLVSEFPVSNRTKNAFIAAGFVSEEDFKNKSLDEIKDVEGVGAKAVVEIREYLHDKFGIVLKRKEKPKKVTNYKESRSIVDHFLKHRKFINWASEIIMAQRLINEYTFDKLINTTPNYKASSLSFYLCADGKKYIQQYLPAISVELKKDSVETSEEEIEEVKLDPDLLKYRAPKSIRDFLK